MSDEQTTTDNSTESADAPPAETLLGGKQEEQAPAEEAPSAEAANTEEAKAEEPTPRTPEAYELKTEGVDADEVSAVEAFAREHDFTNEQAQAYLEQRSALRESWDTAQKESVAAEQAKWVDTIKSDPDIGGTNFDKTVADAKAAMANFATDEFSAILDETGMGNHPELVRMMARVGAAMREGTFSKSDPAPSDRSKTPMAKRFYPNM